MEMTPLMQEVNRYITDTSSTWVPISELSAMPIAELNSGKLVVREKNHVRYITFPYYANMERAIAQMLLKRVAFRKLDEARIESLIKRFEAEESVRIGKQFRYADEQKEGIVTLLSSNFAILTGDPGTGKTSVLKGLVQIIKWLDPYAVITFTAPTGKAARRVTESTSYPAKTLQKEIGDAGIESQDLKPVYSDYFITDEVSMLDMEVLYKVLQCLQPNVRWFLVGDVDQLPSVGIGAILRDLIDSRLIPCCQLQKTFRQDNGSTLFENIMITKKGGYLPLQESSDFERIRSEKNIVEVTINKYLEEVRDKGIYNVGLLTPYRKAGTICSELLNNRIQKIINPFGEGKHFVKAVIRRDDRDLHLTFMEGDPVMQLNNIGKVANGDIGRITTISGKKITVRYLDCSVDYYPDTYNQLDLAYAISICKSQGSEYPSVIIPFMRENTNLDRNMVYTAITRAKKKCCVIGEDEVIQNACKTQSSWQRYTFLSEEMQKIIVIQHIMAATMEANQKEKN